MAGSRLVSRVSWTTEQIQDEIRAEERVWIRLGAGRGWDNVWALRFFEITAGAPPPSWKPGRWEYRNALFEAASHRGRIVAGWLQRGSIPMRSHRFKLQLMGPSNVFRHASGAPSGGYEKLGWPCLEVAFAASSNTQAIDGPLVADGAPPFVTYGLAATAFFGLTADIGRAPETMQSVFRRQDLTGRVVRITIRAADVTVELEGPRIAGALLNLAGPTYSIRKRLGRNGLRVVRFPLQEAVPDGSWVVLHRAGEWIDRRHISWPYSVGTEPGVEIVLEPATKLESLVSAGEGPTTEFKQELPPQRPPDVRDVLKTVAAFANGTGGTMLFGVSNDGDVVGVGRARGIEERLAGLVRSWIHPLPDFEVEILPVKSRDELAVYAITVRAGDRPPYGCGTKPENLGYYVRRGSTTFTIWPEEVRNLARARPPVGTEGAVQQLFK